MSLLLLILGCTLLVSLMAFVGIFTISIKEKTLDKFLLLFVAFSAGALLGGAFLHLLPEAVEGLSGMSPFLYTILGILTFFLMEKLLFWRHCHKGHCHVHTFSYMNLIGDGVHNFIDGMIIAASFVHSIGLGYATTLAVIMHEIPQEIGDFGVLVYGGFSRKKALFYNFLSGLVALLGALVGYYATVAVDGAMLFLLPFAAGGFLYIASSDLIPELHNEPDFKKSMSSFLFVLLGIGLMYAFKLYFEG